ncbi:hypothetical protein ERJ75_000584200 [Trypanosoma vivax]|nr:hypothetical protein ERJ75_000584200 [Trypanosoma vivax]
MCRAGVRNLAHGAADKAARAPDNANERTADNVYGRHHWEARMHWKRWQRRKEGANNYFANGAPSKALFGGGRNGDKGSSRTGGARRHRGKNSCMGDKGAPSQKPGFFCDCGGSCTQRPVSEGVASVTKGAMARRSGEVGQRQGARTVPLWTPAAIVHESLRRGEEHFAELAFDGQEGRTAHGRCSEGREHSTIVRGDGSLR